MTKSKEINTDEYLGESDIDRDKVVEPNGWNKLSTCYGGLLSEIENIPNKYNISRCEDDKTFMQLLYEVGRVLHSDGMFTFQNDYFYMTDENSLSSYVDRLKVIELYREEENYIEVALTNNYSITIGNYLKRLNSKLRDLLP